MRQWPTRGHGACRQPALERRCGLHLGAADGSTDSLAADTEGEAETTIQARYLSELLEALGGDRITIAAGKPGSPIIFTDPDDANFLAVQMPDPPEVVMRAMILLPGNAARPEFFRAVRHDKPKRRTT